MEWITPVLVALFTSTIPSLVSHINSKALLKQNARNSARQSILQLIMEDHLRVAEKRLPENYQAVLEEYDRYSRNGGNSYVHDKVDDYKKWYQEINSKNNN